MHVHWQNSDLEWCDSIRPDNAAIVMVLLNRRSDHTGHADTVTTHGHHLVFAIFALNGRVHRF
ncbi:hypothetical protein D3C80_1913580 [compost metagenome]